MRITAGRVVALVVLLLVVGWVLMLRTPADTERPRGHPCQDASRRAVALQEQQLQGQDNLKTTRALARAEREIKTYCSR